MRHIHMRLHSRTSQLLAWLVASTCTLPVLAASGDGPEHPLLKGCAADTLPLCAADLEARALKAHASQARRDGHVLSLTQGPAKLPMRLDDDATGAVAYRYLGPLAGTELHLVMQWVRGGPARFQPVGPGMASTVKLNAPPWPSPDGRLLGVAVAAGPGQVGQLMLWGRVGPQWRMLYSFDPDPGMGFEFKGWRADGAALRLAWHCPQQGGATQLRDGPYGWDLTPPPPAHCGD
jgi:hypothetical protein